jgi:hypothetical protein
VKAGKTATAVSVSLLNLGWMVGEGDKGCQAEPATLMVGHMPCMASCTSMKV